MPTLSIDCTKNCSKQILSVLHKGHCEGFLESASRITENTIISSVANTRAYSSLSSYMGKEKIPVHRAHSEEPGAQR